MSTDSTNSEQDCSDNSRMNTYDERIAHIKEILARSIDLHQLTIITNKCVELHFEIEMELSNQAIPPLRGELDPRILENLQLY